MKEKISILKKDLPSKGEDWLLRKGRKYFRLCSSFSPPMGWDIGIFRCNKNGELILDREIVCGFGIMHKNAIDMLNQNLKNGR
jgi:hypothetical protein